MRATPSTVGGISRGLHVLLVALLGFAPLAGAQVPEVECDPSGSGVFVTVYPQVASPGEPVQVTLWNFSTEPIVFNSLCLYESVHANEMCEGSYVFAPYCFLQITEVAPGHSWTQSWDQTDDDGEQVPNGTYSISIAYDSGSCCPTLTISSGVPSLGYWGISVLVGFIALIGIGTLRTNTAPGGRPRRRI